MLRSITSRILRPNSGSYVQIRGLTHDYGVQKPISGSYGRFRIITPIFGMSCPATPISDGAQLTTADFSRTLDSMLQEVHGDHNLHSGAYYSWRKAKDRFPNANISLDALRTYVRECPMYQKTRNTDKHGNTCIIVVVEHFSHHQ